MAVLVGHGWALFEQHRRRALVEHRKVEVRDVQQFEVSVVASSRDLVSPLADGRTNSAGARAPDDDRESERRSQIVAGRTAVHRRAQG
jgi:hypothetical protein